MPNAERIRAPLQLRVLQAAEVRDGHQAEDGRVRQREQRRERGARVQPPDVGRQGVHQGPGDEAAVRVVVARVERPRPPEAVADVHQEPVELVDVLGRVVGARRRHGLLQALLVPRQHAAEAGHRRRRRGEVEDVHQGRRRDDDADAGRVAGAGDQGGDLLVEVEDDRVGCDAGGRLEERQTQAVDVGGQVGNRRIGLCGQLIDGGQRHGPTSK